MEAREKEFLTIDDVHFLDPCFCEDEEDNLEKKQSILDDENQNRKGGKANDF